MLGYKFGIVVSKRMRYNNYKTVGVCSCGQHMISNNNHNLKFQCEKCGNDFFVDARNQGRERFVIPYLEAERRDNRGFKVKRVNLSVLYKDGFVKPVKENLKRTIEYDIVDETLKVWREDVLEYERNGNLRFRRDDTNRMFFAQLDEGLFLEFVSNEVTRDLFKIAKDFGGRGWNQKPNILKGLEELASKERKWLQILANAGIPKVGRFRRGGYYYNRNEVVDTFKTKPHEILKVPKFMMSYIREDLTIDRSVLSDLQSHFKNLDVNKFREIMSIVKDEGSFKDLSNCIDYIMQIHVDYGYDNIKKLILYLFREVRLSQGIGSPRDASTYMRDYIRMSRQMGLDWEKYPRSLKKEHDVVQMNYNLLNAGEEKLKLFQASVDKKSYKSLAFGVKDKKSKYAILVPETPEDLIKEGNQLSHCVASYVDDVNNDRCKILFLRDKEQIEKPLATIEVRGLNIRQARGFSNRAIPEEQKEFIKLWAEKNNLVEAYY